MAGDRLCLDLHNGGRPGSAHSVPDKLYSGPVKLINQQRTVSSKRGFALDDNTEGGLPERTVSSKSGFRLEDTAKVV